MVAAVLVIFICLFNHKAPAIGFLESPAASAWAFSPPYPTTTRPRVVPSLASTNDHHPGCLSLNNMMRRSSSLGEESDCDHFETTDTVTEGDNEDSSYPLFRIGLIADIQYAPIPDGYSYSGNARYYRHSLDVARHAAHHFESEGVSLVVNLGDIVDGKCQDLETHGGELPDVKNKDFDPGQEALEEVLDALSGYRGPILHTYGNHCLYNVDRMTLQDKLGMKFVQEPCGDLVGYSKYHLNGMNFITVDSYDIAKMRRCEKTSKKHAQAVEILSRHNPNYPDNENSPEGMSGDSKRFVAFNGAVGEVQLEWLRETLLNVRVSGEKAIILSHQPILPHSSSPICLMWNYEEVLSILREFGDVVVASFSGHAHKGGYKRDRESGIHFRVFEAVLENPHPHKTYALIDIHVDHLVVNGFGNCESAVYTFDHLETAR